MKRMMPMHYELYLDSLFFLNFICNSSTISRFIVGCPEILENGINFLDKHYCKKHENYG